MAPAARPGTFRRDVVTLPHPWGGFHPVRISPGFGSTYTCVTQVPRPCVPWYRSLVSSSSLAPSPPPESDLVVVIQSWTDRRACIVCCVATGEQQVPSGPLSLSGGRRPVGLIW